MPDTESRPNILLILTDQQRFDTLGCYGAPTCRTPHLDALAARGVRFDRAYTGALPCGPSRAALFTGLYSHKNHVTRNGARLNPDVPNLAGELGRAGYNMGYAGKWHVDWPRNPTDYGFEGKDFPGYGYPVPNGLIEGLRFRVQPKAEDTRHYENYLTARGYEVPRILEAHYGDNPREQNHEIYALHSGGIESSFESMVSADTIQLLRAMKERRDRDGTPFFVWANFWGPHSPCLVPEPYYSMYDPEAIPEEPSFGETWDRKPFVQQLVERYWGLSQGGWPRWRQVVARYWGYVTMLDALVGRIVAELGALGCQDNTLVVFASDHGDNMGAHRLFEKGPFSYEQCYRLPLVAAFPRCKAPGSVCTEFVYLHDLFPTFLEAAGRTPPDVPDNTSILDLMRGAGGKLGRDSVYAQFTQQVFAHEQRMIRTRTHKFVFNDADIGELYDLVADPCEMRNLFDLPEAAAVQDELMQAMREQMVRLDDPMLERFAKVRNIY